MDEGIAIADPIVGAGLRSQLLDPEATGGDTTLLTQPALFIFEYALARLRVHVRLAVQQQGSNLNRHRGFQSLTCTH